MISVSGKKWIEKKVNKNSIEKIKQDFNFSEIISKLIINRNFDYNEIYSIEKPSFIVPQELRKRKINKKICKILKFFIFLFFIITNKFD